LVDRSADRLIGRSVDRKKRTKNAYESVAKLS
jgi:hypothetical protein